MDCSGPGGEHCEYHWEYNGSNIGTCIWHNGMNDFQYRLTTDRKKFHSTRHVTIHGCNSTACECYNQVPLCRYGCVPDGYYCWKVTKHNCIGGGSTVNWYRSRGSPITDSELFDGVSDNRIEIETCPGH